MSSWLVQSQNKKTVKKIDKLFDSKEPTYNVSSAYVTAGAR
jgi:hypothetical protein